MKLVYLVPFALAACAPQAEEPSDNAQNDARAPAGEERQVDSGMPLPPGEDAVGTRPAGEPQLATYEGTFGQGVECPTLTLSDGTLYALSVDKNAYAEGAQLEVVGELADASFCMQGEGTIIPDRVVVKE